MSDVRITIAIFMIGELCVILVFWIVTKLFHKRLTLSSVLRGLLERGFLYVTLINALPQSLAFFGALKIATRLKDDNKISNDYFLVGNLVSVFMVIVYYLINQQLN